MSFTFRTYERPIRIPAVEIPGTRQWLEAQAARRFALLRSAAGVMQGSPADAIEDTAALYDGDE